MSIFTRAEKEEQLRVYKAALKACAANQEYTIGSRRYRRADLPELRQTLEWLEGQITVEDARQGASPVRFTPLIPGVRL